MKIYRLLLVFLLLPLVIFAQDDEKEDSKLLSSKTFKGLKFRNIGPAFTSGRIADFAVNPNNFSEYYVAVASGHVWKTTNAGTTFEPIFDKHGAYAIGCVTIDPNNPFTVWVGTGENNHQRALGYGNGVYKTTDGGKNWKNMGLKESRQIGGIVVDPRNSNVVFVAAEGSAWGPGGDRGLYKTVDGGKTWKKTLDISENTGVNNIIFDPRNPDVLYATSEQRRRHVHTKIGGGPESAVYKSYDNGETWEKIMEGLPKVHIGGMGIAISPVNPDVLYLIMEAAEDKSGFFRSTNRGASWNKMSDHASSGQYYNEIYCDPVDVDKVYSVETRSHYTEDAGKTWKRLSNEGRHVDDHALWINPTDTKHFLIGGDGGIYETFDGGETYVFKSNLPVTQFYRVNVDNDFPFYNVYGGTQDNSSFGGPSRTISSDGIVNSDWYVTRGGDGFWQAIDPKDPNIVYSEMQYGGMVRYDKKSKEQLDIRPEPKKGENSYRWNWDTPLLISPHKNTRLYCAAERVFRSEDRGESWEDISGDITAQIDRNTWPVMGKYWSVDAVQKDVSTSLYGTIVSLVESPVKENLLYAGTDDGLIQITEDGKTWRKVDEFPGVPKYTYVSDICASKFDENIVYASFNNLKRDDFKPYIAKSTNKGKSWKLISNNLPDNGSVHTIEQDFVNPNLLFVGTEFSFFFSIDGGDSWIELNNELPNIAVRDIVIQQRENDLVLATFGRGFYVLDNYSPLRDVTQNKLEKEDFIFPVKDALMYIEESGRYGQGSTYYKADNPEFGAALTYYIKDVPKTLKAIRQEKEKELFKNSRPIPQPTAEQLLIEKEELSPYLTFSITDETGSEVRKLTKSASKGVNRITWDLRYENFSPVRIKDDKFNPTAEVSSGLLAMPGKYAVTMYMTAKGETKKLAGPVEFNAVVLNNATLPAKDRKELVEFQKKASALAGKINGTFKFVQDLDVRLEHIKQAVNSTPNIPKELVDDVYAASKILDEVLAAFETPSDRPSSEENPPSPVTFNTRLSDLVYTHWRSTGNLTQKEKRAYDILSADFPPVLAKLKQLYNVDIKKIEAELEKYNTPWTPGRLPE